MYLHFRTQPFQSNKHLSMILIQSQLLLKNLSRIRILILLKLIILLYH
jgi:hypothetical protein